MTDWLVRIYTYKIRSRSTDRDKLTANKLTAKKRFCHSDLVTEILPQSEVLGQMALGIVKHAYNRSSQPIGVIWFAVSLFAVSCRGPCKIADKKELISSLRKKCTKKKEP